MINNTNKMVTQNINNVEGIIMEFMQELVRNEEEKRLNIDSLETLIGNTIAKFTKIIISMSGLALSNINSNNAAIKSKLLYKHGISLNPINVV